jgi:hypothetical protein
MKAQEFIEKVTAELLPTYDPEESPEQVVREYLDDEYSHIEVSPGVFQKIVDGIAKAPTNGTPKEPSQSTGRKQSDEMPELLPFPNRPGYMVDAWGVPWRTKGQGRKAGKVPLEKYWYETGTGQRKFVARYRLTVNGIRKPDTQRFCAMARLNAERAWREVGLPKNEVGLS